MEPHNIPQTVTALDIFKEHDTDVTNLPPTEMISEDGDRCTHDDIHASKHKLFFIRYTPAHTLRQRWYLAQVDLESTLDLNKDKGDIDS